MTQLTFIAEELMAQGSEAWHARRGVVGTSTQTACVMGEPLSYNDSVRTWRQLRSERAFGSTFKGNAGLGARCCGWRPFARAVFNKVHYGEFIAPIRPIWCERPIVEDPIDGRLLVIAQPLPEIPGPTIASSYDGYANAGDFHVWVEIKCPRGKSSKVWKSLAKGQIPDDYYWQVVHQRATFGTQDAVGFFMAYLSDTDYLIIEVADDDRMKSGLFDRDVARVSQEWLKFLTGESQQGDMAEVEGWSTLEEMLLVNRRERSAIELRAKPFADNEKLANKQLKGIVDGLYSGQSVPRIYGRQVEYSNRMSLAFDQNAFMASRPEDEMSRYWEEVTTFTFNMDRWRKDHLDVDLSEFESVKDSWVVNARE